MNLETHLQASTTFAHASGMQLVEIEYHDINKIDGSHVTSSLYWQCSVKELLVWRIKYATLEINVIEYIQTITY